MPVKSVIEAVREAMQEEMRRDDRVFIMGEDVGQRGGVFLATQRSEEHTSELQSLVNLVCRLLLEKKKQIPQHNTPHWHSVTARADVWRDR